MSSSHENRSEYAHINNAEEAKRLKLQKGKKQVNKTIKLHHQKLGRNIHEHLKNSVKPMKHTSTHKAL